MTKKTSYMTLKDNYMVSLRPQCIWRSTSLLLMVPNVMTSDLQLWRTNSVLRDEIGYDAIF